jgi:hypothetical protein
MGRGGKRAGAGRKPKPNIAMVADKDTAARVLALPADEKTGWPGEEKRWLELLNATDERLRFDVQKYLTDRRDGKPVQALQHVTDKPVNVNVTIRRIGSSIATDETPFQNPLGRRGS